MPVIIHRQQGWLALQNDAGNFLLSSSFPGAALFGDYSGAILRMSEDDIREIAGTYGLTVVDSF